MDIAQLGFEVDTKQLEKAVSLLERLEKGGSGNGVVKIQQDIDKMNRSIQSAMGFMRGLVGAFISFQTLRGLGSMADTWSDLTSQVRLAVGEHEDAADVMKRLAVISRQTYSAMGLTAESFTRNATTLNALNKSTQQQLDYAQALNNALVVSGAKADRAAMVQNSLAKAMAEGTLRGEELNNVLNYGSRVATLLAEELGTDVTQLRALAKEGKITGDVLFNALVKNMEKVTEEAESMPATLGDAFTLIQNAVLQLVGVTDQATESTGWLAEILITVADAIDIIAPQVVQLAELWKSQDEAQGGVSVSAEDIAYGMKTVVTGLILAKNAVDVVIAAFRGLIRVGVAVVAEVVDSFQELTLLPGIIKRAMDPRTLGSAVAEYRAVVERNMGRVGRIADEAGEAWKDFTEDFDTNVTDVTNAFAFLLDDTDATTEATKRAEAAGKSYAATAGMTAEQIKKLSDAYAAHVRTMIELSGAGNDMAAAQVAYKLALMDAEQTAKEQLAVGMSMVDVQAQLAASTAVATSTLEEQVAVVLENQRAHDQLLSEIATERKLIGMTDAARNKALAGMRAEQAMRQAIAVAQKAGAGLSAKQVQDYLDQAMALGIANAELDQYRQFLQQIGMTDADIELKIDEDLADPLWEAVKASDALRDALMGAFDMTPAQRLRSEIDALTGALNVQGITAEQSSAIQMQLETKRQQLLENNLGLIAAGIGSLRSVATEGSKSAKILEVAQNAVNLALAIGAVVNQGKGDPYTAFARMAAMAAAVVPLVGSLGGLFGGSGGPAANSAEARQATQGTGTVLGDAAAKSESIARAVDITANATQQLVGINRSMLNAMNAMAAGLAGASTLLARGAGGVDIGPLRTTTGGFVGSLPDPLGITGNIFGGKESLRDQGIRIVGGYLSSMIDDILVQSYASIHRSGGWFSSSRDYDRFESLDDDVAAQFGLVLGSMADAVRAAADALGMNMDAINAAIAAFEIEEIRISTMDLSAEEAQAELAAVFSSIFDGLAGAVVPFIGQFQQVGEGLGETLIRVATGVQVTQEAVIQLGFALDETDPEKFAQISEGLMSLMGGIDGFIEGMSSFVNAFATDEHKFTVAQDAITRAFEQFGLAVPESRDAMWGMMQGLDATTESGRAQIAMLLQLADVSDAYYSMLEDQAAAMARINDAIASGAWEQYLDTLEDGQRAIVELTKHYDDWRDSLITAGATTEQLAAVETQRAVALERLLAAAEAEYQATAQGIAEQLAIARGATDYMQAMVRIERQYQDQVQALNAHARAAGRASASERDLAMALELATIQRAKALMQLEQEAAALAGQLRMSALDAQIAQLSEIEGAATSAMTGFADAIGDAGRAAAEAMGLLLGSYSPLRASDKLPIALQALQRGETDANTVLQIARDVYASGAAYNAIFDQVMAITASQSSGRDVGGGSSAGSTRVSAEMQALLDQRAELEAQQAQRELFTQSSQLAAMIAELSSARGEDYDAIANLLQYDLSQLATDLGLDGLGALTEYLDSVAKEQASIADLFDLPTAGDLEIVGAISDLTDAIVGADFAPGDIPPIEAIPENTRDTEQQDQLAADTREMVTLLRAMVERGLPASEDTATAAERLVDAVERIGDAIESDGGAALAAETRRGG